MADFAAAAAVAGLYRGRAPASLSAIKEEVDTGLASCYVIAAKATAARRW